VVTMEVPTMGESTITRIFLVEIGRNDVNDSVLSFFQKFYDVIPTFFYSFLEWVTKRVDWILNYISKQVEYERTMNHFPVRRYSEMYAVFAVVSQLISYYAMENEFWDDKQAEGFCKSVKEMIGNGRTFYCNY